MGQCEDEIMKGALKNMTSLLFYDTCCAKSNQIDKDVRPAIRYTASLNVECGLKKGPYLR